MTSREVELLNDSFERCKGNPGFLDSFYKLFLASSGEAAEKFKNTDFLKQKRMLKASLFMMFLAASEVKEGYEQLEKIAESHSKRHLDIKPELYKVWLECLIQTVKVFDLDFNAEIEQIWRKAMEKGIDFMIANY
ncbi:globin [bacterium]|nr:globin [bacterium]